MSKVQYSFKDGPIIIGERCSENEEAYKYYEDRGIAYQVISDEEAWGNVYIDGSLFNFHSRKTGKKYYQVMKELRSKK